MRPCIARSLRARTLIALLVLILLATPVAASDVNLETFDACWNLVRERFYDEDLHGVDWDAIGRRYRPHAREATSSNELHDGMRAMLSELHSSHTCVLDGEVHRTLMAELANRRVLTHGVLIEESRSGRFFVRDQFEGGPGERARLEVGDRLVLIEGHAPDLSGWLVDAGYDPGLPGPRLYFLRAQERSALTLLVQRDRDETSRRQIVIEPARMNGVDAARNSVRVLPRHDATIGYVHIWYCSRGAPAAFHDAITGKLADCDALVVDLRGRGGSPAILRVLLSHFYPWRRNVGEPLPPTWHKPTVFLIDRRSRSAKEVMAHIIRQDKLGVLVGERTEGAVLGAAYFRLPDGAWVELPVTDFPSRGVRLEGRGVEPHYPVVMDIPSLAGRDPILERGLEVAAELAAQQDGSVRCAKPRRDRSPTRPARTATVQ